MLQARHGALVSSLVVGAGWALWHAPLLIAADNVMSTYPLVPWVGYVLAASVLYGWLYNNTGGSVLIAVVFHAMSNTVGVFSPQAATVTMIGAAAVVLACGPAHLSRSGQRVVLPAPDPR